MEERIYRCVDASPRRFRPNLVELSEDWDAFAFTVFSCFFLKKKKKGGVTQTLTCPKKKKSVVIYRSLNSRIHKKGWLWLGHYMRVLVFRWYSFPDTSFKIWGYWYSDEIPIPLLWCKTHITYWWLDLTKWAQRQITAATSHTKESCHLINESLWSKLDWNVSNKSNQNSPNSSKKHKRQWNRNLTKEPMINHNGTFPLKQIFWAHWLVREKFFSPGFYSRCCPRGLGLMLLPSPRVW